VVPAGDAAWCAGRYSGMGASAGIAGDELLGTMPGHHRGDVGAALRDREDRM
jgi:hypothetical protein